MKYEHTQLVCPYCGSRSVIFDYETNEYVCTRCGAVIEDHLIDHGFEHRYVDNFENTRTSGSYTFRVHDSGIGSTEFNTRHTGKWLNMSRLQKKIRVEKRNRIVEKALRHLNNYVRILNPPKYVSETAGMILQKAVNGKNYKNKTLKLLAIASLYIAYKVHGIPKSAKMFSKELGITLKDLWHAEKKIHDNVKDINKMIKKDEPENYVPYIVNKLSLSERVQYLANYLIQLSKKAGLNNGKSSVGLATAAVYIASILLNEKRTQIEVAKTVNVTDVTIRNRYSDIVRSFDITISM
ncbi:transcription initiation factor IIB [Staphylothermus hellenicus]|uniref:Transcription initiation factor IIB n=1 Tax=Staphylothermus hellenicus (strain DSM 12710 / JCM 10830 / BK20S6-10-b1 / P8) TaxID=591019 RepID=D7D957_STAHD|nr:transcription initiation factor IIB family protein [Staphylothermus hellenicus]ADI32303.1 Zinc finger TFIIB-type domain protein [Staphylothermus hellenicus DSM 12710]